MQNMVSNFRKCREKSIHGQVPGVPNTTVQVSYNHLQASAEILTPFEGIRAAQNCSCILGTCICHSHHFDEYLYTNIVHVTPCTLYLPNDPPSILVPYKNPEGSRRHVCHLWPRSGPLPHPSSLVPIITRRWAMRVRWTLAT